MKKWKQKGHHGVITQFFSLDVQKLILFSLVDLQNVSNNHSKEFGVIPKGLAPTRDYDHAIHLQPRNTPPNIRTCKYPYALKLILSV